MPHDDETERRLAEFYGPTDERRRKHTACLADLTGRLTEPGVRSLLAALGQVDGLRTVARRSGDGFVLVDVEDAQFWIA